MSTRAYLIGYDLNTPGKDYTNLINKIKEISNGYWHHLDSTWIIKNPGPAKNIRDQLSPFIDANDELLVALLSGEAAWKGFKLKGSEWLKEHL